MPLRQRPALAPARCKALQGALATARGGLPRELLVASYAAWLGFYNVARSTAQLGWSKEEMVAHAAANPNPNPDPNPNPNPNPDPNPNPHQLSEPLDDEATPGSSKARKGRRPDRPERGEWFDDWDEDAVPSMRPKAGAVAALRMLVLDEADALLMPLSKYADATH